MRFTRKADVFGCLALVFIVVAALASFLADAPPLSQWLMGSFVVRFWPSLLVVLNMTTDDLESDGGQLDYLSFVGYIAAAVVSFGCFLDYLGVSQTETEPGYSRVSNPAFRLTFFMALILGGVMGIAKNHECNQRKRNAKDP